MTFSKIKSNMQRAIKAFEQFAESDLFIVFVGWCVVMLSICSLDLLGFLLITALFCLVMMSNCNIKSIYPIMFTLAFVMSNKYSPIYNPSYYLAPFMLTMMIIMATLIITCAVFGIIKRGLSVKITVGFYGMVAFCLSYLISGLIYSNNFGANFLAGSVISLVFFAPFCFFAAFYKKEDFPYIAKSLVMATLVPVVQLAHHFAVNRHLFNTFNKGQIVLGWGVSNAIGIVTAVGIPFAGYFLLKGKYPSLALIAMSFQLIGTVFTMSRASILVAVPMFFGICFYSLFVRKGKKLKELLITAVIIVVVVFLIGLWQWDKLKIAYEWFLSVGTDDRGRSPLILQALDRFRQEIFFGVGVIESVNSGAATYIFFYHNIVVQVLAWSGIVGMIFFVVHIALFVYRVILTRQSLEKWLAVIVFVAIMVDSMLDCVIYYPYLGFIYVLTVIMADKWEKRTKKIRVKMIKT